MIKIIKRYLFVAFMGLTLGAPALVPTIAYATCDNITSNVQNGATGAATGTTPTGSATCDAQANSNPNDIAKIASKIVNFFSVIVGAIAIIMVIYGGFRYITSGGDSGRVGTAKNSLIYAIVGLIIVALAQVLVHFVLNNVAQASQG